MVKSDRNGDYGRQKERNDEDLKIVICSKVLMELFFRDLSAWEWIGSKTS